MLQKHWTPVFTGVTTFYEAVMFDKMKFTSLYEKLKDNSFLSSIIMLSGSTVLGQLLLAISSPVLTRLFTPSDFGMFSQYIAIISVVVVVSSLRYELAIPLPKDEQTAVSLVYISLCLVVVAALATGIVLSFSGSFITAYTKSPKLLKYLWLVPFGVAGAGVYQVLNYWAVRKSLFGALAKTRLRQSVGQLIGQISLGWAVISPAGLFWGDVIGRFSGVMYLVKLFVKDSRNIFPGFKVLFVSLKEYSRFPLFMLWAGLLNALALQVPFLLMPTYFDVASTGLYFQAYRTLILPATLIGGAVSQVFFSESAKLKHEPAKLKELTSRLAFTILSVNAPIYIGLAFVGTDLFSLVFGQKWSEAGRIAQILSPMILIWSVASPLSTLLIIGDRLKESLVFTIIELIFKVFPILIGAHYQSLTLAVSGLSFFGIVFGILSLWRFLRIVGISIRDLFVMFLEILTFNIIMFLSLFITIGHKNMSLVMFIILVPLTIYYSVKKRYRPLAV